MKNSNKCHKEICDIYPTEFGRKVRLAFIRKCSQRNMAKRLIVYIYNTNRVVVWNNYIIIL